MRGRTGIMLGKRVFCFLLGWQAYLDSERILGKEKGGVLLWDMVDKSLSHLQTSFRLFFVSGQSGQDTSSWREAPFECCCRHLHPSPRDKTQHLPLATVALKRKSVARGMRAPRAPSIDGWFCQLPSPAYVAGSVAPSVCHLAQWTAREIGRAHV